MEQTQREGRIIPGVLFLASMHGRCQFHGLPAVMSHRTVPYEAISLPLALTISSASTPK